MLVSIWIALTLSVTSIIQDPPRVEVPSFPNSTCPIMGKKASLPLFVDTELGRIYVCCKPCFKKIRADVPVAHKTAYPVIEELSNKVCPISGEPIDENAVAVTLQGFKFRVCCDGCADTAREQSQLVLTKLNRAKLTDIGNQTCPISGKPVSANSFVLIDQHIVHLASPQLIAEASEDPHAVLAKAKEIAAKQPPPKKHEHVKKDRLQPATRAASKSVAGDGQ